MNKKLFFTVVLLMFFFANLCYAESNPGNTGLAFLKIGAGGRAVGMGEAFTAISNDASATYWNPAGLASMQRSQFMFTHNKWFQGITHGFASVAFNINENYFGLSFISNSVDGIERRVNPSTEPLYTIDAHDIMIGVSFAKKYHKNLQWGVTLKYLYEKIYLENTYGAALDLGVIYKTPVAGLNVGAVIQNLGTMSEFKEEKITLPAMAKVGASYTLPSEEYGAWTVVADLIQIFDANLHVHTGLEYELKKIIALRIGYLNGYEERTIQGGLGFKLKRYRIDYAYVPFSSDIGNSHRISFGFSF